MIAQHLLTELATRALAEDLCGGDLTTLAIIRSEMPATALVIANQELVVCGGPIFAATFYAVDGGVVVEQLADEGSLVGAGDELFRITGPADSLLGAERTGLNFLQRLSGIATLTRQYVAQVPPGHSLRIADTRKTTPGLRLLERYAVRTGGGHNHRDSLGSAIMIKDNHLRAAGGVTQAVKLAKAYAPHTSKIEVEVASLEELDEALQAGADIVMLDNFEDDALSAAMERARGKALIEVSGGITLQRISLLVQLGVDVVSVGALTHSAPAADISLDLALVADGAP